MGKSNKAYCRLVYLTWGLMLVVGGILRVALKLFFTDASTGFYQENGWLSIAFSAVLAAGCVLLLLMNALRKGTGDYRISGRSAAVSLLALLAGAAILLYVWLGLPIPLGQPNPDANPKWEQYIRIINQVLGSAAAVSFAAAGVWGLLGKSPPALLSILPALWQIVLLLSRFNGYHSVLYIPDHLLAVLFMLFATLFYLGHARTLSGLSRKDGRNYVISSGLCASACGFLLVVPNYIYMAAYGAGMPVALLSIPESVYVLAMSFYAMSFAVSYMRSIRDA